MSFLEKRFSAESFLMRASFLAIFIWPLSTFAQSGAAGGATSSETNPELEYCDQTLGTMVVYENTQEHWYQDYSRRYPRLGSTVPVLRLMVQQSNCFVVVERGKALKNVMGERQLEDSGELRAGSGFEKNQLVAADYTMSPSIQFAQETGGLGGALGGLFGSKNKQLGAIVGGLKRNQAATTLLLVDNRSSVQVAASAGEAQKFDFSAGLGGISRSAGGALTGFTDTPEGKVIISAFADSYNKMVRALRQYQSQNVEGGLGKGGRLKVGN